ncbi:MAG: glycoside hydrolase family 5 protein [Sedimentisphaerales bacterium]
MRLRIAFKSMALALAVLFLAVAAAGGAGKESSIDSKAKSSSSQVKAGMPLPLKVKGNQILNSKNEPVTLRGVNTSTLEFTSDGEGHIIETIRVAIDDWKVNIIRLPLSQDRWFGKAPDQNDDYKSYRLLVKEAVDLCNSKRCYIILDLHWSDANEWGKNIGQQSMPDRNSVIFWKDIASLYANNPSVLFDIYNEPRDVTWDVWLNGGTTTSRPNRPGAGLRPITYETVGMQEMLNTIRATGAKNVVVVGGLDWAYDFSGILEGRQLKDPNGNGVIYANHVYDNKSESVFTWIANMEEASAKFPIIVSEFGGAGGPNRRGGWWGQSPSTAMGDDWLLHVLQAIQDHNWSFTAWDLHTTAGPVLISDWNYMPTPEFGVYVKELLVKGKLPKYTPPDINKIAEESTSTLPESARMGGSKLYGDWLIKADPCDRMGGSIISFAGNSEGRTIGQWINARGFTELDDVRSKDNSVTFTQTVQFKKEAFKGFFAGTIEGNKLTGTLTHGGMKSKMEGTRRPMMPLAAGIWDMKLKTTGSESSAILDINAGKDGILSAEWQKIEGNRKITDVKCEGNKLTFKSTTKVQNAENVCSFEGTIEPKTNTLTGVFKTDGNEMPAEAKRIGTELIGTWILDVAAPWGNSKQRLKVNSDMSGMYGVTPIDKITIEGDKVTFKIAPEFGRMRFEMDFEGKLDGTKLTGELKNPRGSQVVTGKKVS